MTLSPAQSKLTTIVFGIAIFSVGPSLLPAQVVAGNHGPAKISIDEEVLAAFVDEPCNHFESAKRAFVIRRYSDAANHLRVASAFLQLESARALDETKVKLDASISELQRLAVDVERSQVASVDTLGGAFARAHYALAGHHCVKSAHACCQLDAPQHAQHSVQAGRDLKAAATHMQRGLTWSGEESDEHMSQVINSANLSADQLIRGGRASHGKANHAIRSIRNRLQGLTGLKISLAPPLTDRDDVAPSLFR